MLMGSNYIADCLHCVAKLTSTLRLQNLLVCWASITHSNVSCYFNYRQWKWGWKVCRFFHSLLL